MFIFTQIIFYYVEKFKHLIVISDFFYVLLIILCTVCLSFSLAGFDHCNLPCSIQLECVRLCFQVFLEGSMPGQFTFPLKPIVTAPVYLKHDIPDNGMFLMDSLVCVITLCTC